MIALATPEASYITGMEIKVNDGRGQV